MKTGQIAKIAAAGLFLLVAVFFFLAQVSNELMGVVTAYGGFAIALGGTPSMTGEGISALPSEVLEAAKEAAKWNQGEGSILFLLIFVLAIIGLVVALLAAFDVIKLDNKIVSFVIIGVAALILIFYVVSYVTFFGALDENTTLEVALEFFDIGFAFWAGLVAAVLAAGAGVFNLLKGNE